MGLDITAYSRLEPIPKSKLPKDEDERYEHYVHAFAYAGFERSTRGLPNHDVVTTEGQYEWIADSWFRHTEGTETHSFRAGSYGGYGVFRRMIAELVNTTPERAWKDRPTEIPFFELINFADNEGCIGPDAAKDLLADFRKFRDAWVTKVKSTEEGDYYVEKYDDWITACELAADHGLIEFS